MRFPSPNVLIWLLLPPLCLSGAYTRPAGPTLRELAIARGLDFGGNFPTLVNGTGSNNWASNKLVDEEKAIARDHFTIASAGWEMFPGNTWTGPETCNFTGTLTFLDWCDQQNIKVHGHGLGYVREGSSPAPVWFVNRPRATEDEKVELRRLYRHYLDSTLTTLHERIDVWDVCNETLAAGKYFGSGYFLTHPLWQIYSTGPDSQTGFAYLEETFRRARQLDPSARLIHLDYGNEVPSNKASAGLQLVRDFQSKGIPLDGMGFQMHISTASPIGPANLPTDRDYFIGLRENWQRYADLGQDLYITELSVAINTSRERASELERQADIYAQVFTAALEQPRLRAIKLWGCLDKQLYGVLTDAPYLFDDQSQAKPAFFAVQDILADYHPRLRAEDGFVNNADWSTGGSGWVTPWQAVGGPTIVPDGFYGEAVRLPPGAALTRTVNLGGQVSALLFFRWKVSGNQTGPANSGAWVEASRDGQTWITLRQFKGKFGPAHEWQPAFAQLDDLSSETALQLRFRVDADYGADRVWTIDEIRLLANAFREPADPYADWLSRHGLSSEATGRGTPTAAPAGDGWPNLVRFCLGLDPLQPGLANRVGGGTRASGQNQAQQPGWSIRHLQPLPDGYTLTFQSSADGLQWSVVPPADIQTAPEPGLTTLWIPATGRTFLRLQAARTAR